MSANNSVVLIGRAGNTPAEDMRTTQSGSQVVEVRLAVNRPKGKDGNAVTDWISCQFWNRQADVLAEYVKKGDLLSVSGAIRIDNWEKEGEKRQKLYVFGENFQMLESRSSREERQGHEGGGQPKYGDKPKQNQQKKSDDDFSDDFALDDDELPPF